MKQLSLSKRFKHVTFGATVRRRFGGNSSVSRPLCQLALAATFCLPLAAQQREVVGPVLVVHGGVDDTKPGQLSEQEEAAVRAGITRALTQGYGILKKGGSSLDAVEAALRSFEDDTSSEFDAGRGAVLDTEGVAQLDASIMDGATLKAGSVAAVEHIAHPISLARLVMEQTNHVSWWALAPRSLLSLIGSN